MDDLSVDLLLSDQARRLAAANNGIDLGKRGDIRPSVMAFHEGSAKAYLDATNLLVGYQRRSKAAYGGRICMLKVTTSKLRRPNDCR